MSEYKLRPSYFNDAGVNLPIGNETQEWMNASLGPRRANSANPALMDDWQWHTFMATGANAGSPNNCAHDFPQRDGRCLGCQRQMDGRMTIPDDLRWVVQRMIDLHSAGWEVRGYTGGGPDDRTQFVKVEFRRVKRDGTE